MTKITCTRRIQFCAGHRVHGHESKCSNLHGHNYVAFFHAQAEDLDSVGRVIDFSVLKERIGGWIDTHWDHGFIVSRHDEQVRSLLADFAIKNSLGQKVFVMDVNPTAENMAAFLLDDVCLRQLHDTGVEVTKVVLWETENCFATAETEHPVELRDLIR